MRYLPLAIACLELTTTFVSAQEPDTLAEMKRRVALITATGDHATAAVIGDQPLLRYSDPTRDIRDAAIWAVGKDGRPQCLLVMELYDRDPRFWSYEMTLTSEIVADRFSTPGWKWSPDGKEHEWRDLSLPDPANGAAARLLQMKNFARALDVSEEWFQERYQLRLLPKPLHRYQDEKVGILDGVLFAYTHGTNVEVILQLELRQPTDQPARWRGSLSRLSAASILVKHDDQDLWSLPEKLGISPSYFNAQLELPTR